MKKALLIVGLLASSNVFAEIKNLDSHLSNLNSFFKQDDQNNTTLEIGGKMPNSDKKCQLTYINRTKIDPYFPVSSYQSRGIQLSIITEDEKFASFNMSALSIEGDLTLKRTTGASILKANVKNEIGETAFIGSQNLSISKKSNSLNELTVEIQDEFSNKAKATCIISL